MFVVSHKLLTTSSYSFCPLMTFPVNGSAHHRGDSISFQISAAWRCFKAFWFLGAQTPLILMKRKGVSFVSHPVPRSYLAILHVAEVYIMPLVRFMSYRPSFLAMLHGTLMDHYHYSGPSWGSWGSLMDTGCVESCHLLISHLI